MAKLLSFPYGFMNKIETKNTPLRSKRSPINKLSFARCLWMVAVISKIYKISSKNNFGSSLSKKRILDTSKIHPESYNRRAYPVTPQQMAEKVEALRGKGLAMYTYQYLYDRVVGAKRNPPRWKVWIKNLRFLIFLFVEGFQTKFVSRHTGPSLGWSSCFAISPKNNL